MGQLAEAAERRQIGSWSDMRIFLMVLVAMVGGCMRSGRRIRRDEAVTDVDPQLARRITAGEAGECGGAGDFERLWQRAKCSA